MHPIHRVLSTLRSNRVRHLLMGGQACVLYGAAEFGRDTDVCLVADADNLANLRSALEELVAECIVVPPFEAGYLQKGHAVHFRCGHPECRGMRLHVMAVMRGVAPFEELWARRNTVDLAPGAVCDVLALPDLVRAKKTQRDKDWLMLRRLVEVDYFDAYLTDDPSRVAFWLRELRTPDLLADLCALRGAEARRAARARTAVRAALDDDVEAVRECMADEERLEREADAVYWLPLRRELEQLRRRSLQ